MLLTDAKSIFSPATGFIARGGFDFTCNPYLGCSFGCLYCYAAYLPQNPHPADQWGKWLTAKRNAVELAARQGKKLAGKALYMSSVTDPYQPVERSLMLSRGILEALVRHQPRLAVQTRGPLVVRDIDVLSQFESARVNFSIPTDSEEVRVRFEPKAPPLEKRWAAVGELAASGVPVGVCVTPTLPIENAERFADRIAAIHPAVVVTQDFHDAGGKFGADTGEAAWETRRAMKWGSDEYARFVGVLRTRVRVFEGEAGFFPPGEAERV
jgi:DNA repair photolyase